VRILHVIHDYDPVIGGSETLVQRIGEGMAARGDEVVVFTSTARSVSDFVRPNAGAFAAGVEVRNGVTVRRFPFLRLPPQLRRGFNFLARRWWQRRWPAYGHVKTAWVGPHLPGLAREIKRLRPQLILAATVPFLPLYQAARAGFAAGIPVLLLPCLHPSDPWLLDNPPLFPLLRRADGVITLTRYESLFLRSMGVEPGRIHLLGGGVDEQAAQRTPVPDLRACFGLSESEPLVLFLGRKEEGKGIQAVVEAMVRLWQGGRRAGLVLAGASTEYSRNVFSPWLTQLPSEWRGRIVSRDDIDEDEKWGWYAECDVLAHPSAVESFGLIYLEAWLMGKPVVAGRNGPTASLVDHGRDGLLVGHGAVDELASALERLLDDPTLARRLGEEGRAKVLREYTWPRIVDRAHAIYQTVAGTAHGEPSPQRDRCHLQ
jgi:glycosyltransferase involved in cell wall biosynthesis